MATNNKRTNFQNVYMENDIYIYISSKRHTMSMR